MEPSAVIAIVEGSEDLADLLSTVFQDEGFQTATILAADIRRGLVGAEDFLREHDPRVIIYDISVPFDENWRFLQRLTATPVAAGRRFILTSTNVGVLERMVGATAGYEIVPKPFDLEEMIEAVRQALEVD
jgi:DNA-binding response OmpR family regulator